MKDFEQLASHLACIWSPQSRHKWAVQGGIFTFQVPVTTSAHFLWSDEIANANGIISMETILMLISQSDMSQGTPLALSCYYRTGEIFAKALIRDRYEEIGLSTEGIHASRDSPVSQELRHYTDQWLPLFRRNCFLSGCPIECSAHEQIEWNQWFAERRHTEKCQ